MSIKTEILLSSSLNQFYPSRNLHMLCFARLFLECGPLSLYPDHVPSPLSSQMPYDSEGKTVCKVCILVSYIRLYTTHTSFVKVWSLLQAPRFCSPYQHEIRYHSQLLLP